MDNTYVEGKLNMSRSGLILTLYDICAMYSLLTAWNLALEVLLDALQQGTYGY